MCLGVPGQVRSIDGHLATVDFWGVQKQVRLDTVDEPVTPGDYILNHVGFAIRRIPDAEIEQTMALYESFITGDPEDALAEDIIDEIEGGGFVPSMTVDEPQADAQDAEDLLAELDINV